MSDRLDKERLDELEQTIAGLQETIAGLKKKLESIWEKILIWGAGSVVGVLGITIAIAMSVAGQSGENGNDGEDGKDADNELIESNLSRNRVFIDNVFFKVESIVPNAEDVKNEIMDDEDAVRKLKGDRGDDGQDALSHPGVIVASIQECENLPGWTDLEEGAGRFLVGVGTGTDAKKYTRIFGEHEKMGAYEEKIEIINLPARSTSKDEIFDEGKKILGYLVRLEAPTSGHTFLSGAGDIHWYVHAKKKVELEGEGRPMNNLPPYYAVYWCKKL